MYLVFNMEDKRINTIIIDNPSPKLKEFVRKMQEQKAEQRKKILEQKSYTFTINV